MKRDPERATCKLPACAGVMSMNSDNMFKTGGVAEAYNFCLNKPIFLHRDQQDEDIECWHWAPGPSGAMFNPATSRS